MVSCRVATGVLAALRLEAFGPGAGVLPHERTMGGPKQDRLRLLEATRANTSPVVFLAGGDAVATGARPGPPDRPTAGRSREHGRWHQP